MLIWDWFDDHEFSANDFSFGLECWRTRIDWAGLDWSSLVRLTSPDIPDLWKQFTGSSLFSKTLWVLPRKCSFIFSHLISSSLDCVIILGKTIKVLLMSSQGFLLRLFPFVSIVCLHLLPFEDILNLLNYDCTIRPGWCGKFWKDFCLLKVDLEWSHLRKAVVSHFGQTRNWCIDHNFKFRKFVFYLPFNKSGKWSIFLLIVIRAPGMFLTVLAMFYVNCRIPLIFLSFHVFGC